MRLFGRPETYIITSECAPKQKHRVKTKRIPFELLQAGFTTAMLRPPIEVYDYPNPPTSAHTLATDTNTLLLEFLATATLLHLNLSTTRGFGVATKPHKMPNLVLTRPTLGVELFGSNVSRAFDLTKCGTTVWSGTSIGTFFLGLTHRNVG